MIEGVDDEKVVGGCGREFGVGLRGAGFLGFFGLDFLVFVWFGSWDLVFWPFLVFLLVY
jgi:hypothetical protein